VKTLHENTDKCSAALNVVEMSGSDTKEGAVRHPTEVHPWRKSEDTLEKEKDLLNLTRSVKVTPWNYEIPKLKCAHIKQSTKGSQSM
jgi:hypothetical protein